MHNLPINVEAGDEQLPFTDDKDQPLSPDDRSLALSPDNNQSLMHKKCQPPSNDDNQPSQPQDEQPHSLPQNGQPPSPFFQDEQPCSLPQNGQPSSPLPQDGWLPSPLPQDGQLPSPLFQDEWPPSPLPQDKQPPSQDIQLLSSDDHQQPSPHNGQQSCINDDQLCTAVHELPEQSLSPYQLTTSEKHRYIREEADRNYRKAAERMKLQYSKLKGKKIRTYALGDKVSLRIPRNERSSSDIPRLLCEVIEVKGNHLYRLM